MDVRFEQVSMAFGEKNVLENLNFKIPANSLVSILGPSGCGKSTSLMLMSGLMQPSAGKIWFGDQDVTKKDALEREIGMVFQNYALYPHLTVLENIMFPLKMKKVPKKLRKEKALEYAKLVQIEEHINKRPKELSGGQQQRVAIARALVKEPAILLMDEPLSNLDARLRIEMREEIRRIQQETQITTVFVTHDQAEALSISDQVMVLNQGVVQQISSPQELYREPDNLFVAKFLGEPEINLLTPAQVNGQLPSGTTQIGVRPEDWQLAKGALTVTGMVLAVEFIGKEKLVKLQLPDQEIIRVISLKEEEIIAGMSLDLTVSPDKWLLFDAEGQRIEGGQ